jgi:hypothetical protein
MPEPWPFADPPNLGVITTVKVLDENKPILLVAHDQDDGGWQFLCGTSNDPGDGRVVGLDCIVAKDASLRELADLPLGWCAWRSSSSDPWQREPNRTAAT